MIEKTVFAVLRRLAAGAAMLLGAIAALAILVGTFLGTADVMLLHLAARPVPGALELTESLMVIIIFCGLAYVEKTDGQIRMDLVYDYLSGRFRSVVDVLGALITAGFLGLLAWRGFVSTRASQDASEVAVGLLTYPLAPFKAFVAAGAAVATVLVLVRLHRGPHGEHDFRY